MKFRDLPVGAYFRNVYGVTVYLKVTDTLCMCGNTVMKYPLDELVTPVTPDT